MKSDELYHYGRKGQKWGEHIFEKDKSSSGGRTLVRAKKSLSKNSKKLGSFLMKKRSDRKEIRRLTKKKNVKKMTNKELDERLNRIKKENEYKREVKNSKPKSKALDALRKITVDPTINIASQAFKSGEAWAANKVIDYVNEDRVDKFERVYANNKK